MERTDRGSGWLADKAALVTGAGRGIGRAIALELGRRGVAVCCVSRTSGQTAETVEEIRAAGGTGLSVEADVTDEKAIERAFSAAAETFGALHIVVANAGTNLDRRTVERSVPDDFRETLAVNLVGTYLTVRAAIPYLRGVGGGHIVTIGSGLGQRGTAGSGAYACSKAGIHVLTQLLSGELKEYGIAVNELVPGPVKTELSRPVWDRPGSVFQGNEWIKNPEDVPPLLMTILSMDPAKSPSGQTFSLMARVV